MGFVNIRGDVSWFNTDSAAKAEIDKWNPTTSKDLTKNRALHLK